MADKAVRGLQCNEMYGTVHTRPAQDAQDLALVMVVVVVVMPVQMMARLL